jgi:Probable cobalt transporter subunit (CbtA)
MMGGTSWPFLVTERGGRVAGGLLLRGLLAGILAGLLAAGFSYLAGEPSIERAIAFESAADQAAGLLGLSYAEYSDAEREAVVHAHPRTAHFKEDIIQAFYDGIKHKPETTFGNVKADVLADKDPHFTRGNFCSVIRGSAWRG